MKRITTITLCLLLGLAVVCAASAEKLDGPTVLKKMLEAEEHASFTAHQVTTITRKPSLTSEQIVYRDGLKGMRMEYLAPPGLKGEVMADDGKRLAHYIPKEKVVKMHPSRLAVLKMRSDQISQGLAKKELQITLIGKDKVAGRNAYVVEVKPRLRRQGQTRKFWVDTEKWVKLKTEDIAPDGSVASTSYYKKIDFTGSISGDKFRIEPPAGVRVEQDPASNMPMSVEEAQKAAKFRLLQPTYLPPGFKPAGATVIPFRHGVMVGLRYTDGVSSFTFFQTPLAPGNRGHLRHGPVQPGKGVYSWRLGDMNLTLVGPVISPDQMRRIADSVK